MKWINLGLAILMVLIVSCLDIPDEFTVQMEMPEEECFIGRPCAIGTYMIDWKDDCPHCLRCVSVEEYHDGYEPVWLEIDCGDFPWENLKE